MAIVKSHGKKYENYFRVTTPPFARMQLKKKGIKCKMMDFDYYEEYLTSISNKILS